MGTHTWSFTGSLHSIPIGIFRDTYWIAEPVVGELHVLDSTETTLHNAGSTSEFRTIHFWLEDPTDDLPTLENDFAALTTITLTDWLGDSYNVKIRDLRVTRHLKDVKRTASNYQVAQIQARLQKV
jgi:hypothetical protein